MECSRAVSAEVGSWAEGRIQAEHPRDLAYSTAWAQGDLQMEWFHLLAVTARLLGKAEWLRY